MDRDPNSYPTTTGSPAKRGKKIFASNREYQEHLARQKGFASLHQYREHLAQKRGFASYRKYQEYLAKRKGFASQTDYREHLANQRQEKAENRELSAFIRRKLIEAGRTQSWLADQIGCTRQTVSLYAHGKIRPRDSAVLERIHAVLEAR